MPKSPKVKFVLLVGILGFFSVFVLLPALGHAWRKKHPFISPAVVPASQWKYFSSTAGKFRVMFPGSPQETNVTITTSSTNMIMPCFFVWADRQTEYAVDYADFPKTLRHLTPQQQFDLAQAQIEAHFGNVATQRDYYFGNYPARDFQFIVGGKGNFSGKVRFILNDERLYQVMVIFLPKTPHDDDFKIFFDSFSITTEETK